jgi:hypothetical protein
MQINNCNSQVHVEIRSGQCKDTKPEVGLPSAAWNAVRCAVNDKHSASDSQKTRPDIVTTTLLVRTQRLLTQRLRNLRLLNIKLQNLKLSHQIQGSQLIRACELLNMECQNLIKNEVVQLKKQAVKVKSNA